MLPRSSLWSRSTTLLLSVLVGVTLSVGSAPNASAQPSSGSLLRAGAATTLQPSAKKAKVRITKQPKSATISRYGIKTSVTLKVKAKGTKRRYQWQYRAAGSADWVAVPGAKKSRYTAKASAWGTGTGFRVLVTGKKGKATSKAATLTVLYPTNTPAADAQSAFGLTGLSQGVDLSAWQYGIAMTPVTAWVGASGFTMLRNASGSRPVNTSYADLCSGSPASTGAVPVTKDCAYAGLADASTAAGRRLGHYWFNGWIAATDPTSSHAFAGGYTPEASAAQYVTWLLADGNYTRTSTDPLVLDIETGGAWTKTINGKKKTVTLRAWTPSEATRFLSTVRQRLTGAGYHANLYVYLNSSAASTKKDGRYVWRDVAAFTRLWVAAWGTDNGRIPAAQPKTGPWTTWSIWQYTSNARIAGSGKDGLDADIAKADAWSPR